MGDELFTVIEHCFSPAGPDVRYTPLLSVVLEALKLLGHDIEMLALGSAAPLFETRPYISLAIVDCDKRAEEIIRR